MSSPLAGRRVVVTRPVHQSRALVQRLAALGAEVVALPLIETVPIPTSPELDAALAALGRYQVIVVTSANGADCLADRLDERGIELPDGPLVVAVGGATAARLRDRGLRVDRVPAQATGAEIAAALTTEGVAGDRILLPRARAGRPELPAALRSAGATVDDIALYHTVRLSPSPDAVADVLASDLVVLTAPSAAGSLAGALGPERSTVVTVVSIGPTTSAAARAAGFTVAAESPAQSVDGLVDAVLRSVPRASD
jgi:uroporphyrinogen-III synthase